MHAHVLRLRVSAHAAVPVLSIVQSILLLVVQWRGRRPVGDVALLCRSAAAVQHLPTLGWQQL